MAASENLKKAVLYAKAQCGLKPFFQAMQDEEIIYYLDHLADTGGENRSAEEIESVDEIIKEVEKVMKDESYSDGQQVFDL